MIGVIIFAIIGLGLLMFGLRIKVSKKIDSISFINEERLRKIKNRDKVASDFGNGMILLAIACFVCAGLIYFAGRVGSFIGLILIIIASTRWSSLNSSIDEKIKRKEY